jgi:hypothetical protein
VSSTYGDAQAEQGEQIEENAQIALHQERNGCSFDDVSLPITFWEVRLANGIDDACLASEHRLFQVRIRNITKLFVLPIARKIRLHAKDIIGIRAGVEMDQLRYRLDGLAQEASLSIRQGRAPKNKLRCHGQAKRPLGGGCVERGSSKPAVRIDLSAPNTTTSLNRSVSHEALLPRTCETSWEEGLVCTATSRPAHYVYRTAKLFKTYRIHRTPKRV